mgnify:CR=1 FL=1
MKEDSAQVQADTAVLDETADEQPSGTWTVDEQPGTDTKGLGHRLLQTSSATTYFTLPQYEPSGEKTLRVPRTASGTMAILDITGMLHSAFSAPDGD